MEDKPKLLRNQYIAAFEEELLARVKEDPKAVIPQALSEDEFCTMLEIIGAAKQGDPLHVAFMDKITIGLPRGRHVGPRYRLNKYARFAALWYLIVYGAVSFDEFPNATELLWANAERFQYRCKFHTDKLFQLIKMGHHYNVLHADPSVFGVCMREFARDIDVLVEPALSPAPAVRRPAPGVRGPAPGPAPGGRRVVGRPAPAPPPLGRRIPVGGMPVKVVYGGVLD